MSARAKAVGKEVVSTDLAPAALGPYSQAIKIDGVLYVSGCLGIFPESMKFAGDSVEEQTDQLMKNMGEILKAAGADYSNVEKQQCYFKKDPPARSCLAVKDLPLDGADYSNVVKTTVLLADIGDFKVMNGIYAEYFKKDPPARSCFAVKDLPLGAKVEVECIAKL
eukprot:CAMPEP_0113931148 /NCGR_PEP_ID=MMETSP1159-20121227/6365_1 /TAXON_ID=88271 /ORGANISM="Picocystis salinarum" /LENGTH=165 /DNA_ID=CAMNT_0000932051 /DNA_START=212 /DNA_END=711 /DNA_ORIENTATION=+ /assembly_acc=CAM_ASM_000767